MYILQYILC